MRLVKQRHENGCVPACLAMIGRFSYAEALRLFPHQDWDEDGTTYKLTTQKLIKLGCKFSISRAPTRLSKLDHDAILLIKHRAYGPPGHQSHAVVWDVKKQRVLDPYPSAKRSLKKPMSLNQYSRAIHLAIQVWKSTTSGE